MHGYYLKCNVKCTAVTMTVGLAYNRCIGTAAESPKKGMQADGTGIQDPTEMQSPSRLQWQISRSDWRPMGASPSGSLRGTVGAYAP